MEVLMGCLKLAVANHKGGVGKSAVAVHLACGLARLGRRVLLVDADLQADACRWVGLGDVRGRPGFLDVLLGRGLQRYLMGDVGRGLWVLPPGHGEVERGLRARPLFELRRFFEPRFDYVVIDTPPSWMPYLEDALALADFVVCPVQPSLGSIRGLADLMGFLGEMPARERPELAFIVPVMVDRRQRRLLRELLEPLFELKGELIAPAIPVGSVVAQSYMAGRSLFDFAPSHRVTGAFLELVRHVVGVLEGKEGLDGQGWKGAGAGAFVWERGEA